MTTKKVNFDLLVSRRIHSPTVDNYPVYARIDTSDSGYLKEMQSRSEKWHKTTAKCYTSPDNIRRVFITASGVYVHLFQPVHGVSDRGLVLHRAFPESVVTMLQKGTYLSGAGLSGIAKPWVCQNIEEVYIEGIILLSIFGVTDYSGAPSKDIMQTVFEQSCLSGVGSVSTRFPRLRLFASVLDLDTLYTSTPNKSGIKTLRDLRTAWCETPEFKQLLKVGQANIIFFKETNKPSLEFSIKPNIYRYDAEILEPYLKTLTARLALESKERVMQSKAENAPTSMGNFERSLLELWHLVGGDSVVMGRFMRDILSGETKEGKSKLYTELTQESREQFGALFREGGETT